MGCLYCWLFPFPDLCFVYHMPCSQPPWRRLKRTQQTNTEQLNLAKLILATPLKTKQCMIMLLSFWQVWRTHRILRRQRQNVLRTLGHRPCATNITATKLLPRLLYRRLCGSKGSSKGGVAIAVDPPRLPALYLEEGEGRKKNIGRIATGIWSSPLAFGLVKLNFVDK